MTGRQIYRRGMVMQVLGFVFLAFSYMIHSDIWHLLLLLCPVGGIMYLQLLWYWPEPRRLGRDRP